MIRRLVLPCWLLLLASCAPAPEGADGDRGGLYREVTAERGPDFRHVHGGSGRKYLVETNGSGAAWLDHDGDGALDVYLVQGAPLPGYTGDPDLQNQLFRQVDGRFEDVTERARVGDRHHGMAAAAPDVDEDGDPDLFVTNHGPNVLYRNDGRGVFDEVTRAAGLADSDVYHSSCLFADLDRDGDLDLYVVRYVDWSLENNPDCGDLERGEEWRSYCHPDMFQGYHDLLYRNDGGGRFTNVSEEAGITGARGKGLGVAAADVDEDGDLDLFVANDSNENQLWLNDGDLHLVDGASRYGVDFNGRGSTEACMGCDFADVDGDGDLDLFTVNLSGETNTLWIKEGTSFRDRSGPSGLGLPSEDFVGFGAVLADLDRDGAVDIVINNGHVLDNASLIDPKLRHAQVPHLYRGDGQGRFRLLSPAEAGAFFAEPHVGRSLAAADFDDDGDLDLLFTINNGTARLLEARADPRNGWIGFALEGRTSNRQGIGAQVTVRSAAHLWRSQVRGSSSYLAWHDTRVLIGLGQDPGPFHGEVRWPDGRVQDLGALEPGRYHPVIEPE